MSELVEEIYENRFSGLENYRNNVWKTLITDYFSRWIKHDSFVLDLGCGYGEFINNISRCKTFAMDLNPNCKKYLKKETTFFMQNCSKEWSMDSNFLDLIFTSNFFEHLSSKKSLEDTINEAYRCLKPGGKLIALGPNISVLKGHYWDFWDHHIPISDQSIKELMEIKNFEIEVLIPRFLPYNMVRIKKRPLWMVSTYLKFPLAWRIFGKQFLIVGKKVT